MGGWDGPSAPEPGTSRADGSTRFDGLPAARLHGKDEEERKHKQAEAVQRGAAAERRGGEAGGEWGACQTARGDQAPGVGEFNQLHTCLTR